MTARPQAGTPAMRSAVTASAAFIAVAFSRSVRRSEKRVAGHPARPAYTTFIQETHHGPFAGNTRQATRER